MASGGGRREEEEEAKREGDVVLPRPPPQLPLPALCRVFPEAAAGGSREQLRCSAILCLSPAVPCLSAAATELTNCKSKWVQ
ncbi:Protein Diaphanous 1 [Manis pentadactyla]|nr:Protein Diaphanous 1 [Manis pentadactyla]